MRYRLTNALMIVIGCALLAAGCERTQRSPASFSPAEKVLRNGDTIARCNTVHSLTLPSRMLERLQLVAGPNKAILSCSLQVLSNGVPRNVVADVQGTALPLSGSPRPIGFEEVREEETISYVATFDIEAKVGIRFDVVLVDPRTGVRYPLEMEQTAL